MEKISSNFQPILEGVKISCFNRTIDNSKILTATGLQQMDLILPKSGLAKELATLPKNFIWSESDINERMDAFLKKLVRLGKTI